MLWPSEIGKSAKGSSMKNMDMTRKQGRNPQTLRESLSLVMTGGLLVFIDMSVQGNRSNSAKWAITSGKVGVLVRELRGLRPPPSRFASLGNIFAMAGGPVREPLGLRQLLSSFASWRNTFAMAGGPVRLHPSANLSRLSSASSVNTFATAGGPVPVLPSASFSLSSFARWVNICGTAGAVVRVPQRCRLSSATSADIFATAGGPVRARLLFATAIGWKFLIGTKAALIAKFPTVAIGGRRLNSASRAAASLNGIGKTSAGNVLWILSRRGTLNRMKRKTAICKFCRPSPTNRGEWLRHLLKR
jgi:hypothetical protein